MKDYTEIFFVSTAEDQENYFTGDNVSIKNSVFGEDNELNEGEYRIIDGELHKIVSGLRKKEITSLFDSIQ